MEDRRDRRRCGRGRRDRDGGVTDSSREALTSAFQWGRHEEGEAESAHQTDGTDSNASFEAKIADEGTIPA